MLCVLLLTPPSLPLVQMLLDDFVSEQAAAFLVLLRAKVGGWMGAPQPRLRTPVLQAGRFRAEAAFCLPVAWTEAPRPTRCHLNSPEFFVCIAYGAAAVRRCRALPAG